MFTLEKAFRFEAAHRLPSHDGKCARLHGHSWVLRVRCRGVQLVTGGPKAGMLIDYGDIAGVVRPYLESALDHHYLNESTGLENPTSEELARWVYNHLSPVLPSLVAVIIEETCTARCEYSPDAD